MKVSVIIPTMKGREKLLAKLVLSVPRSKALETEVIIVDDEDILLAAKRNKGALKATGEYLFFVDDDNYLEKGAIESALAEAEMPDVGVVGFMACYDNFKDIVADGGSMRNYLTGFTKGVNTNAHWPSLPKKAYEVDEIANAFMINAELFWALGGLDEKNFPIDLDEADFCKRVKNFGLKVLVAPLARCYHKSQTYSAIPDFRRPMNAYCMGRHRVYFQRNFNNRLRFCVYLVFFLPLCVGFYSLSLLYRKKPSLIFHFLKGVFDGLRGCSSHPYRKG